MKRTLLTLIATGTLCGQDHARWSDYGGSPDAAQYSSLKQIDRTNVSKLKLAWSFPTGDNNRYFFNPLIVDNVMYVMAKNISIVALNATTGQEIWTHTPHTKYIVNRGINYWESKDRSERRLFVISDHHLRAIDARTGKLIPGYNVNLKEGLDRDPEKIALVQSLTPGRVFGDLLILGSATNQGYGSAPGDIRAFDVRTGKVVWTFHTVPRPGEYGYDTWPKDAWKSVGGANVWSEFSLDVPRAILYAPTASAKYNFYGADRTGSNLFSDCLLALDARTGKRLWHYQMVHHDIWDYDDATAPKLLTVNRNGKKVDIVAQVSKQGFIWVFDRVTGKPIWPIEERPVPPSSMKKEKTWPTQPFPTKPPPFARQTFTVDDLSPYLSSEDRAKFRDDILSADNRGLFTPPGTRNTIQMPGNNGGANWGGAAVDPLSGRLYVVSKDLPAMLKLENETEQKRAAKDSPEQHGLALYTAKCGACHGVDRLGKPPAIPGVASVALNSTRAELEIIIQQGKASMPATQLTADELNSLIMYLYNPTRATANVPAAPGVASDEKYFTGFGFMIASNGLSPIKPPWSSMTAYDLNEGTILWKIPLGDVPQLAAKGIKGTGSHFPKVGPVVTAGGLIFTGTRDKKVRALDIDTGSILWEAEVGAALEGIAATYEVNGKQYVVFCASAQVGLTPGTQTKIEGAYVAFALP